MQIIKQPDRDSWAGLLQRPYNDNTKLLDDVRKIINRVRAEGDTALYTYSREFDGVQLDDLAVPTNEIKEATSFVPAQLKDAIRQAISNIKKFHAAQFQPVEVIQTMPGIECWRKSVGIEKIGLYIPGGSAPLFSTVLMLAIPAVLAGCREIVLCTPPARSGKVHPVILYAAAQCGISMIFKTGGAQAIAAMAYGTASIPKVYKIFGPGNQFVTAAKQLVQVDGVAIDMPAGPSEVCVLADDSANPVFVAADLLSQAEHGADSQVILISTSEVLVRQTVDEIEKQLEKLPRKDIAQKALHHSKAIIIDSIETGIDLANLYAAEHLIISCRSADDVAAKIINAGSVFIGNHSPESVGDYASGTNHTLPTNGFARAYSGVSIDSFVKKITFQRLSEEGLKGISDTVISMAEAEGLEAHANAVRVRTRAV